MISITMRIVNPEDKDEFYEINTTGDGSYNILIPDKDGQEKIVVLKEYNMYCFFDKVFKEII